MLTSNLECRTSKNVLVSFQLRIEQDDLAVRRPALSGLHAVGLEQPTLDGSRFRFLDRVGRGGADGANANRVR